MHRTFTALSVAFLLGGSLPLMAQPITPQPTDGKPAERATLTGCVRDLRTAGSSSAGTTTPGAPADSHGATSYVLEVLRAGTAGADASEMPAAPARPAPERTVLPGDKATYPLVTKDPSELAKHVNHLVEITGTRATHAGMTAAPGASTAGTRTGTSAPGTTSTATERPGTGDPRNPQPPPGAMIEIITLRMVSATCPGS